MHGKYPDIDFALRTGFVFYKQCGTSEHLPDFDCRFANFEYSVKLSSKTRMSESYLSLHVSVMQIISFSPAVHMLTFS